MGAKLGNKNALGSRSRLGQHSSEESRAKNRQAHLGVYPSEETKAKMSKSQLGKPHQKGWHLSKEARERRSKSLMGNKNSLGFRPTEETKAKLSKARIDRHPQPMQGKHHSEEARKKLAELALQLWANPEWKDNQVKIIMSAASIKPNIPELKLQAILDELYPGEWKYTGNGEIIIGGKNPDFTNVNGKKQVIELFGDYWHRGEDPQDRIAHFKGYGFRCLVVWERELKDTETLSKRIVECLEQGKQ